MKPEIVFLLENASWPAFLVEAAGILRRVNKAAIQTFGSVVEGETTLLHSIWSPENTTSSEQFLGSAERAISSTVSFRFLVKGGETFTFSTCVCPISYDERKYFLFQLFKVPSGQTQFINKAEGASLDANIAHKQKLDCALQLARTVSLDFNNALTSILGHTSLILSKMESGNPWRNSLVEVEKSASKAAEIANDLANFSRQEKDAKVQMSGNLNVLLQRTVDMFRTPEKKKIEWTLQFERKLFTSVFDEAKMQQAFVKIIENAAQAVDDNGRISVQSRNIERTEAGQDGTVKLVPGTYVCVEISDNGSGIQPDVLPRIFEPFFTTKGKEHRGLGLVWVYGIVTNHGGGVAVSSQIGVGTSVRVYLPATKKIVKESAVEATDLTGTQTILIVDDEDLLLTMGQMILTAYGYQVVTANSGQRALEILSQQNGIDLVITDLVMPNMSGRELIERIRKSNPNTRIICSSGYVRGQNVAEEDVYLQKPFTSQDLLRKVKQALSND